MTKINIGETIISNETVIKELREYIKLLSSMLQDGFKCTNEIAVALKVLHEAMGLGYDGENAISKFKNNFNKDIGKLILVGEEDRRIGKSHILSEYSKKYNIPVIVKFGSTKDYYHNEFNLEVYKSIEEVKNLDNGVLIDCQVSMDEILKIKNLRVKICGGFYHNTFIA